MSKYGLGRCPRKKSHVSRGYSGRRSATSHCGNETTYGTGTTIFESPHAKSVSTHIRTMCLVDDAHVPGCVCGTTNRGAPRLPLWARVADSMIRRARSRRCGANMCMYEK